MFIHLLNKKFPTAAAAARVWMKEREREKKDFLFCYLFHGQTSSFGKGDGEKKKTPLSRCGNLQLLFHLFISTIFKFQDAGVVSLFEFKIVYHFFVTSFLCFWLSSLFFGIFKTVDFFFFFVEMQRGKFPVRTVEIFLVTCSVDSGIFIGALG